MRKKVVSILILIFIMSSGHLKVRSLYLRQAEASSDIVSIYFAVADELYNLERAYVSHVNIPGNSGRMRIMGDKLYVINDDPSLQMVDISDPDTMTMMAPSGKFRMDSPLTFDFGRKLIIDDEEELKCAQNTGAADFSIENNNLYFTPSPLYFGLYRVDLSEASPRIVDVFSCIEDSFFDSLPYLIEDPIAIISFHIDTESKRALFFSRMVSAVWVFNLSDTDNVYLEATLPSISRVNRIKDNKIYAFSNQKFSITDISDLNNPQEISELPLINYSPWRCLSGGIVKEHMAINLTMLSFKLVF